MPEYEYRCKKCEESIVIERSMNDTSAATCVHCGGEDLSRVWVANFISGKAASGKASSSAESEMCASNPAKPKGCCPCG